MIDKTFFPIPQMTLKVFPGSRKQAELSLDFLCVVISGGRIQMAQNKRRRGKIYIYIFLAVAVYNNYLI